MMAEVGGGGDTGRLIPDREARIRRRGLLTCFVLAGLATGVLLGAAPGRSDSGVLAVRAVARADVPALASGKPPLSPNQADVTVRARGG